MTTVTNLPHWDMSVVYPSLESQEFQAEFARVVQDISELAGLFDACHVEKQEAFATDEETIKNFETVLQRYNEVLAESKTLNTYLSCFVNTNTFDTLAQAHMSELQQASVELAQLGTRFTAWIGSLDEQGECKELPMSMVRNLAFESDRETRRRAYGAELAGWQKVAVPLAVALA